MISNADLAFVEPTGIFSTSGTKTEANADKRITGVIKNEGLPASTFNYYINLLTTNELDSIVAFTNIISELDNLLAYFSVTPNAGSDIQLRDAIVTAFITGVFSNTNTTAASSGAGAIKTAGGLYTTKNIYAETTVSGSSIISRGDATVGADLEVASDILSRGVTSILGRIADSNGALTGLIPVIDVVEGTPGTVSPLTYPSMVALSKSRIAIAKVGNDELLTYDFDGSTWSELNSVSTSTLSRPSITALTSTLVAYIDHTSPTLRLYNPVTWAAISGGSLSIPSLTYPVITAVSSDTIALLDASDKTLKEYSWSGSALFLNSSTNVASKITGNDLAITTLGNRVVVFLDCASGYIQTYWNYNYGGLGFFRLSSYNTGRTYGNAKIVALSNNHIVIIDDTSDAMYIYGIEYQTKSDTDTLTWQPLGSVSRSNTYPAIASMGSGRLAFLDEDSSLYTNKVLWQPPTAFELF
jgi:hypothetical protein